MKCIISHRDPYHTPASCKPYLWGMQTILVVEDNKELRENTAELLQLAGFNVITSTNGEEGLQLTIDQHPDLILCDLIMPKAGGMELLQNKKNNNTISDIPLVFLSAGSASFNHRSGFRADGYLSKPFTYEQLLKTIKQILKKN